MNTDGSHGPLNCGACHEADDATGIPTWVAGLTYNGQPITTFDQATSWAHTYTDEADPLTTVCLNCHGDNSGDVSDHEEEWLVHAMVGRVSRNAMDKAEVAILGDVAGASNPLTTVCTGCHSYPDGFHTAAKVTACSTGWKLHLTEGRVAESVWEAVSTSLAGGTCGY
jgi:formate-dependent nitrite reductase cytochrome c552 subunit